MMERCGRTAAVICAGVVGTGPPRSTSIWAWERGREKWQEGQEEQVEQVEQEGQEGQVGQVGQEGQEKEEREAVVAVVAGVGTRVRKGGEKREYGVRAA